MHQFKLSRATFLNCLTPAVALTLPWMWRRSKNRGFLPREVNILTVSTGVVDSTEVLP
jgi:hypothetical protein